MQCLTENWSSETELLRRFVVGPGGGDAGAAVHGQRLSRARHPGPVHGGGEHTELSLGVPIHQSGFKK